VVSEGLAACCNVVPAIESIYMWKGKVCHEAEALCIFKTREDIFVKFRERVVELHTYEIPEVVAFDITAGEARYLKWLEETCGAEYKKMF
jgi:periplasmic divalent cation tolerance protein